MTAPFLFQRQWKLTLVPRGQTVASVYVSNPEKGLPLQMQFDVKRTLHATSNKATFRLYNLEPAQRQLFDVGARVILNCGYGASADDFASPVYLGDVTKKTAKQEGGDIVLELECGDSELLLQQCVVKCQFAAPARLVDVLQDIAAQLRVSIAGQIYIGKNGIAQRLPDVTIKRFCQCGPARIVLDALLKGRDIEWSFQNGQLLLQAKQGIVQVVATDLSPQTGLLERPSLSEQGLTCRALIQPSIAPGGAIALTTSEPNLSGNYRVVEAQYKGETMGGDWAVEIQAEPLGNLLAPYAEKTAQTNFAGAVDEQAEEIDEEAAL